MICISNDDIFLLASSCKGLPLTLLEAMACRIPVIAVDIIGVASEVIKNNCGIIIKPRDSQASAEAVIRLLKNPKLAKKSVKIEKIGRREIWMGGDCKKIEKI